MLDRLLSLVGTVGAVGGSIVVIFIGRLILNRAVSDKRTVPYHRQFLTLIVSLVGLFLAIALLPLEATIRAQILSVLGIVLSAVIALSSTTLVGNAMAGIMLRLMKTYRAGDFVRFDDTLGRITDISLFHTEIQKVTRDLVAVPNSLLVSKAVHITRRDGTFVNAQVSIGYSEHHAAVEAALKEAAEQCELSEPFVLVDELLDHAVHYRVYALLAESHELISKTSQLRASILDVLHARGIEVVSPGIVNRREYPIDHHFVPPPQRVPETGDEQSDIEGIVFDRAEQAESIEKLYAMQEKLKHDLDALKDPESAAAAGRDAQWQARQKNRIKAQIDYISAEVARREKEKEEQRLDEDASG
jgi:small conductance mechanosensitive channel